MDTDGRTDVRADGRASGRADEQADGWTGGRTDGQTGGRMDKRADGRAGGRIDGRSGGQSGERAGLVSFWHGGWFRHFPLSRITETLHISKKASMAYYVSQSIQRRTPPLQTKGTLRIPG